MSGWHTTWRPGALAWRGAVVTGALALALAPRPALAQGLQGSMFAAAGQVFCPDGCDVATAHAGGGAELLLDGRFGLSGEIGYLTPARALGSGVGAFSANGTWHVGRNVGNGRWRPFLTAGYTMFFRDGMANLFNAGVGVDHWLGRRTGLRFELRDHIWPSDGDTAHLWGLRVGVVLRSNPSRT